MSLFRVYEPEECGEDGYPFAWHEAIKHEVRAQAGNRCVRCGHPYEKGMGEWSPCDQGCSHGATWRYQTPGGEWHPYHGITETPSALPSMAGMLHLGWPVEAQWRVLTVHHLNGIKRDCRWWNLASLCQRCHLRIQRTVVMDRVFPWEHSDWFKPYAAGFYAVAYLGQDVTREEAVERMDELLALEWVA